MEIIAIANQKGGTGKTTTAVTMSHKLAQEGYRVLLVDTDPQSHVAAALGLEEAPGIYRAVKWYDSDSELLTVRARPNLDIIPSSAKAERAKTELAGITFRELVLKDALGHLAPGYDIAVIDCAPSVDVLHIAALVAADWLVIPTRLDYLSVDGVDKVIRFQRRIREKQSGASSLLGILPTFFDRRTNETLEQLQILHDAFGDLVLPPIPIDVKLRECPSYGETIWEYAPGTRSIVGINGPNGNHYGGYANFVERVIEKIRSS